MYSNPMWPALQCSTQLSSEICKRAQKTFGAVGKGNLLPLGMYEPKQSLPFLMTKYIFCESELILNYNNS